MGKMGKALAKGALVFVVLVIIGVAIVLGLRWYNGGKYTILQQTSAMGAAQYETGDSIQAIEDGYLKGFHFIPEKRAHPGTVVVYGGSEGSPGYVQAKAISEQGYEVLALYFWGQDGQAPTLANVPLEQFDEVTAYIEGSIERPRPITVVGTSKGAEFSAELAAHGFAIDNLVNFAPADHTYFGLDFTSQDELPSFTYRGEAVPYASYRNSDFGTSMKLMWDMMTNVPPSYRATYESAAANSGGVGEIDLSGFGGNALFFAGAEDAMWQSGPAAESLAAMSDAFEAHVYPGAGHAFSRDIAAYGTGWEILFGGTAEGSAAAYEDSTAVLYDRLDRWHGSMDSGL